MARRTIFFAVTVVAVWIARGVWDYNPDLRERIEDHPWQSVGLLTLGIVTIVLLVWAHYNLVWWKVTLAFVLGVAVTLWGRELLGGIGWEQVGIFVGCLAALVLLWALTVLDFAAAGHSRVANWVRARLNVAPAHP